MRIYPIEGHARVHGRYQTSGGQRAQGSTSDSAAYLTPAAPPTSAGVPLRLAAGPYRGS
jgi:hypothetical protein